MEQITNAAGAARNYMTGLSGWSMGTLPIIVTFALALVCSIGLFAISDWLWNAKTNGERHLKKEALFWSLGTAVLVNLVILWLPALIGWIAYLVLSVIYAYLYLTGIELNVLKVEASQLNDDPLTRGFAFLSGFLAYAFPMYILSRLKDPIGHIGVKGIITIAVVVVTVILMGIKVAIVSTEFNRRFGDTRKPKRPQKGDFKEAARNQIHSSQNNTQKGEV
jgi:hypothetical protein